MKKLLLLLCFGLLLIGCATNKTSYIPYHDTIHKDIWYEWSPHDDGIEWWYLTGYVSDKNDELYFYQFTIFRACLIRYPIYLFDAYALNLSFTDCSTSHHIFVEDIKLPSDSVYGDSKCIVFKDTNVCIDKENIKIQGNSDTFRLNLEGKAAKSPVWHGRDGKIIMGHPDLPRERSYYYSFTNIDTQVNIEFKDKQGNWTTVNGSGKSWFDRQWGRFSEVGWEWFSFRFFDNEEIMLFSFPKTGHKEGTFIDKKGRVVTFNDYKYDVKKVVSFNGKKIGLGWKISLPFKEKEYEIVPIVEDQFNPFSKNNYWEGIAKVFNNQGQLVGYCVIENSERARSD